MKRRSFAIAGGLAALLLFVGAGCSAYKASNKNTNADADTGSALQALNGNANANITAIENTNSQDVSGVNANSVQNSNTISAGNANASVILNKNTNTAARSARAVSIQNFAFTPADLDIPAGTTVTWTNLDSVAHTVTGDNGGPDSGTISPQGTYSYTFSTPGSYPYHCAPHPYMTGTVTVTE